MDWYKDLKNNNESFMLSLFNKKILLYESKVNATCYTLVGGLFYVKV